MTNPLSAVEASVDRRDRKGHTPRADIARLADTQAIRFKDCLLVMGCIRSIVGFFRSIVIPSPCLPVLGFDL